MINNKLISISLFTGAFGLDIGLEQVGFNTVAVVEKDADATKTIVLNRPHLYHSAIPRSIETVSAQNLLEEGGKVLDIGRSLQPGEVDLVTGGPPCQPFSTAGKRGSVIDPRGSLFMDFIRIVREVQPRFFIMERESARIQTFPDDWHFYGSVTSKYRQIGNAVPVLLAKAIGDYLYNLIQGNKPQGKEIAEQLSIFSIS